VISRDASAGRGRLASHLWEWAAVAAVFAAITVAVGVWLSIDRHPPEWDYANHLESAVHCRRALAAGDVGAVFGRSAFYPPLVSCAAGVVYAIWPSDAVFGEIVMLGFLGVGMAAVYALGRRLGGGAAGIVAATLFGTAPVVVHHALHFQLDVPLASLVALFLAVLLASDGLERRGLTLAAGLIFGLGMLTKPPFLLYVAPACAVVIARARGRRPTLHAVAAAVLAVVIALPWYAPRAFGLSAQVQNRSFKQAAESGFPSALSGASLAYYPANFPLQVGVVAVLLLLLGVGVAIRRHCWYVVAGLAPVIVLLALQNKQMRYALPLLPVVSVAGGLGFAALPRAGRYVAALAIGATAVVQVSATVFALPAAIRVPLVGAVRMESVPPSTADWRHRAILELIDRDSAGASPTVSIAANHPYFSASNFRYYAVRDQRRLRIARAWEGEPIGIDYMILKTGDLGPAWSIDKARRVGERLGTDAPLARVFPVIGEFPLPDGSTAAVRARRLPSNVDMSPDALARAVMSGVRVRLGEVMRDVDDLQVRIEHDARIGSGHVRRLEITAAAATLGELRRRDAALLRVHGLRLIVDDVLVNPWSARDGRFDPLDARHFTLDRALIAAADLETFLGRVKGVGRLSVTLGAGFVDLVFQVPGPDVAARVRLVDAADRPLALVAQEVRIGGIPVPSPLVGWLMRSFDPSRGLAARLPFPATVKPLTVTPASIRIGAV
jgi:hypothetical protein